MAAESYQRLGGYESILQGSTSGPFVTTDLKTTESGLRYRNAATSGVSTSWR